MLFRSAVEIQAVAGPQHVAVATVDELEPPLEEFLFLLQGRLEFVHGGDRFALGPGDCLYLDGRVPHGGRALGRREAVAVVVSAPAS